MSAPRARRSQKTATPTPSRERVPFVTIVTAAGRGVRMGGPKALLAVPGGDVVGERPLAVAHARTHRDAGAVRVVIVVRTEAASVLAGFAQRGVEVLVSNAPDELGPSGSIRCALEYLELPDDAWLCIAPVDSVPVAATTLDALSARAARSPGVLAVRPVARGGRRGHPVLVQRRVLEPMLAAKPPTLRELLAELGDGIDDVHVDDDAIVADLDHPDDVVRALGSPPRFFERPAG